MAVSSNMLRKHYDFMMFVQLRLQITHRVKDDTIRYPGTNKYVVINNNTYYENSSMQLNKTEKVYTCVTLSTNNGLFSDESSQSTLMIKFKHLCWLKYQ